MQKKYITQVKDVCKKYDVWQLCHISKLAYLLIWRKYFQSSSL